MSTPTSPPVTVRPVARAGLAARRLAHLPRTFVRALVLILRRPLARLLWLLRGWSGLIAGALVALALGLGPAGGARWIATQATTLYRHVVAAVTLWYQTAYDAVAWPAATGVAAVRATQAWARHGYHGLVPTIHTSTWAFWMRHGAAWRYTTLRSRAGAPVRAAIPLELGGVLALLVLFAVFVMIGRKKHTLDPTRANTYGGARWQTWDELRRRRARPGDMVLGTARRGLKRVTVGVPSSLLLEGVAIDAPTGLGKSNAFFKTQLLEPDPTVDYVATDNKGDGWTQTAAALSRTHDCYRLDMQTPAASVTWAPLALVRTPAKAEDWARAWLHNSKPADSAPPQPYFEQAVLLLMAAGVMHVHAVAAAAGRPSGTLDELLALLLQPNVEAIEKALKNGPSGAETGPAAQFLGLIAEHRDLRSSIPSGLAPRLSALADPAIKAVVGGLGTLDLDRLGRTGRPVALYIVIPAGDDTLRPLVAALFTTMFTVLLDRARTLPNGELAREVRMLLDEFGTMGAIPHAPTWFNICRQPRISRVISFQSFSQLVDDYGELGAKAIIDSCNVLAWLGGTSGDDAKWASEALGHRTVLARGEGDSAAPGGLFGRRPERDSRSASEAGVPLLFPDDLAASSRRRVVAIAREARPMDLRTRPMWSVRAMRRLMTRPAPRACVEAPTRPHPAMAAVAPAQTSPLQGAQVVVVPDAARGATPTGPWAPVRVTAKTPAATATAAPAPTPATSTPPTVLPVTSGPARLPTAPVKHGTAYDWTGLP